MMIDWVMVISPLVEIYTYVHAWDSCCEMGDHTT